MTASAKPKVVGDTHPVDVKDYDSYSWVLLEDHPLRSYPTKYPPGLLNFLGRWYATAKRWWSERGMSLVSLFVMFLMVIQFLANLPYGVSYLFVKDLSDQEGIAQWPAEFDGRSSACIFYDPQAHVDVIDRAIYAGCAGIKADVWSHDDSLVVGDSSKPNQKNTFSTVYLEPLMARLDARNPAVASSASLNPIPVGLFDHDPAQPFVLFLQLRPSLSTAWPHLLSQLDSLSQKGYLTYTDGLQIYSKPVSIVVTGLDSSEVDSVKDVGHDGISGSIFFDNPRRLDPIGSERASEISTDMHHPEDEFEHAEGSLSQLSSGLSSKMFSVTINFRESIGSPRGGRFSVKQIERIQAQIRSAHLQRLPIRYHAIPCLPNMVRRIVWRVLVHEGADYIEMDLTQCERRPLRSLFTIG